MPDSIIKNKDPYKSLKIGLSRGPKFTHDCNYCKFLGRFIPVKDWENYEYDLYWCDNTLTSEATVIARWGNDGSEYLSGISFARPDGTLPLYEAKNRAIELGYKQIYEI